MADWFLIFVIAISLAMDCLAVSLGIGCAMPNCDKRAVFRLSFHFGFFQSGMTLLGWLAGNTILPFIANYDHWFAFLLLAWIGVRMLHEGLSKEGVQINGDPTRGRMLVLLSLATSIDALGVGMSLSIIKTDIAFSSFLIGMVSLIATIFGLKSGNRLNLRFGKKIEILGGLILISIGTHFLLSHLGL